MYHLRIPTSDHNDGDYVPEQYCIFQLVFTRYIEVVQCDMSMLVLRYLSVECVDPNGLDVKDSKVTKMYQHVLKRFSQALFKVFKWLHLLYYIIKNRIYCCIFVTLYRGLYLNLQFTLHPDFKNSIKIPCKKKFITHTYLVILQRNVDPNLCSVIQICTCNSHTFV